MRVETADATGFEFGPGRVALVLPMCEETSRPECPALQDRDADFLRDLKQGDIFRAKARQVYYLPTPSAPYSGVLALGLGKRDSVDAETLRRAAGAACGALAANRITDVAFDTTPDLPAPAHAFVEGLMLGQYRFDTYKEVKDSEPKPVQVERVTILLSGPDADASGVRDTCELAVLACENANWARDLANTASNDMTPSHLARIAEETASETGCSCEVLDEERMAELKMNALLGVSRGSAEPARMIIMKYIHAEDARTVAIIGKGITFDSGGISIKPSSNMHEMKYDMCGAAAVLGAFRAIARLKPRLNVVCVIPAAENLPDGKAQKPGDIVRAYNGKTIEVRNTDAEGRLILADAMAYTVDIYNPAAIVDLATLTGACVVALGHYAAGLMSNDDALCASLENASARTGERVWRLPIWDDYAKLIEGTHADLSNIGPAGEAGAITGACFLKAFAGDTPWAHLDIAGAAWGGKNIAYASPDNASGYGVRLLVDWVLSEAK